MKLTEKLQGASIGESVEIFKIEFRKRYTDSKFLIDGDGYEDEDLDLNIYVEGDEIEIAKYAAEISHIVQQRTGYFILPFILPLTSYPVSNPNLGASPQLGEGLGSHLKY